MLFSWLSGCSGALHFFFLLISGTLGGLGGGGFGGGTLVEALGEALGDLLLGVPASGTKLELDWMADVSLVVVEFLEVLASSGLLA